MNPSDHPPIERISELQEGILPDPDAADVRAHVDRCEQCQATLAELTAVSELLAAEGARPVAMPADVAERVTAALGAAAGQQPGGVTSLEKRRAERAGRPGRRAHGIVNRLFKELEQPAAVRDALMREGVEPQVLAIALSLLDREAG